MTVEPWVEKNSVNSKGEDTNSTVYVFPYYEIYLKIEMSWVSIHDL